MESDLDVIQVEPDSDSTLTNGEPARYEAQQEVHMVSSARNKENWSDFDRREVVDVSDHPQNETDTLRRELFGHKETFLPNQRNLYLHLYFTDLTRFGQDKSFLTIKELAA